MINGFWGGSSSRKYICEIIIWGKETACLDQLAKDSFRLHIPNESWWWGSLKCQEKILFHDAMMMMWDLFYFLGYISRLIEWERNLCPEAGLAGGRAPTDDDYDAKIFYSYIQRFFGLIPRKCWARSRYYYSLKRRGSSEFKLIPLLL